MVSNRLKELLDERVALYNTPAFIPDDPICIPHRYRKKQDIEIAGLWTAVLSWGRRSTIISKANHLMELMDDAPHDFIVHHHEADRQRFEQFVHRTFQAVDALYFLQFLQDWYRAHDSLEDAFLTTTGQQPGKMKESIAAFHEIFFASEWAPKRTRKHVGTPLRGSSCKRINMFLRWMVRQDEAGVDFGLWNRMRMRDLMIPLDVHVHRVATRLGLLERKQSDWKAVEELTDVLRKLDPHDPVKYDYALFGMGVLEQ